MKWVSNRFIGVWMAAMVIGWTAPLVAGDGHVGVDLLVVTDLSGSMRGHGAVRFEKLFEWIDKLTQKGDRVGVVSMGYRSSLVQSLTDAEAFSFGDVRAHLGGREKFTDVAAGLENAFYELKTHGGPGRQKVILLYSDAQIDMPRGQWDLKNSMRYLLNALVPSMKTEGVRLDGVVPEGARGNFMLLQELTSKTGGSYYRGLPADALATRADWVGGSGTARSQVAKRPVKPVAAPIKKVETQVVAKSLAARYTPVVKKEPETAAIKTQATESTTALTSDKTSGSMGTIGAVAVGLLVLLGIGGLLIRRRRAAVASTEEELNAVLTEVKSLQNLGALHRSSTVAGSDDDDDEPDFGEPKDELSVSLVSPFLDYAEVDGQTGMDEISSRPAFAPNKEDDPLSVSTMETLIGTAMPDVGMKD